MTAADEPVHPRETPRLFGHDAAVQTLLDAYRGGRIPHAWIIGGANGIGKATLAYQLARFVFAHPDPSSSDVQNAQSLTVSPDHRVASRIIARGHPDLLELHRTLNDKGKLHKFISVEDVRKIVPFFGSTAGEGGWRIAIVDSVDELNDQGENALLKMLEEPPARSLFLLISHIPGAVRATIRSRCRRLSLRPLSVDEVAAATAQAHGKSTNDNDLRAAADASGGSVERALALLDGGSLALRQKLLDQLARLPQVDARALHALGDSLTGADQRTFAALMETINEWLTQQLRASGGKPQRQAQIAASYEALNRAASDTEEYGADRRPLLFDMFGLLAKAARA